MITSPITGGLTTLIKKIPTSRIAQYYKDYNVTPLFNGHSEIELRECTDTGYRFYYPYNVTGDDAYYQHLSKEALYYIPWKWEHQIADTYIQDGDTVLEQGCANGEFLLTERNNKNIQPYGTELNTAARANAKASGISFKKTTSANMACSFQVLEHIAEVRAFITEAIDSVIPGGYILFGVPNNDALLKDDMNGFLNMPPHHMGLWTKRAFESLPKHFPIELIATHTEILQPHHYRYYYQVYFGDRFKQYGFPGKLFNKIVYECFAKWYIKAKAKTITGHTIIAVFKKKTT